MTLAGCTAGDDGSTAAGENSSTGETTLRVMSFNIEYGGDQVDFDSVAAAIEAADADVVGIQEGYAKMPAIAADLGWQYYDARTQVVSRYPLLTPADTESAAVFVETGSGQSVALLNVHLSSSAYGPNRVAAGVEKDALTSIEKKQRLPELEPVLDEAQTLIGQGIPTFILGDLNAPSHLDWTPEAVGLRSHVRYAMKWPTSVAAEEAGLTDTFRVSSPDPVEEQGLTWPASRPFVKGYNPGPDGRPADRIDVILAGGEVATEDVLIVGESGSEFSDITVSPWPTDHRGVVGSYRVVPGPTPTLVSTDQRLGVIGQDRLVSYSASAADAKSLTVTPSDPAVSMTSLDTEVSDVRGGTWTLNTDALPAGSYDVTLTSTDGERLAGTVLALVEPGTAPTMTTDRRTYGVGEPVVVEWADAPGNKWDWLGVYRRGADPNVAYYKNWAYTGASISGRATIDGDAEGGPWPLPTGEYSIYLLADDSYQKLAGVDFSVVDGTETAS